MADGDEYARQGDVFGTAAVECQTHAGHAAVVTQYFIQGGVELELDLAFLDLGHQLVDQDLLGAEGIAAVYQHDLLGDIGQVQGLFHGGVATTDHCHFLIAVEETVTGSTGGDALAHEGFFRRQPQVAGRGAGGDDQRITGVLALIAGQNEGALLQVNLVDVVEDDLCLEALGMLAHALHQIRALQAFHITGPVIDIGGGGELTAHLHSGNQQWLEVGPCSIYSSAVASRARAQNDQTGVACFRH